MMKIPPSSLSQRDEQVIAGKYQAQSPFSKDFQKDDNSIAEVFTKLIDQGKIMEMIANQQKELDNLRN